MDSNETRLGTTGIIWVAYTVIMVSALAAATNMSGGMLVMLVIIFTVAALSATSIIWKNRTLPNAQQPETAEKAKRRSRIERVLENMDDEELAELRTRLAEEETVSLEGLLLKNERA